MEPDDRDYITPAYLLVHKSTVCGRGVAVADCGNEYHTCDFTQTMGKYWFIFKMRVVIYDNVMCLPDSGLPDYMSPTKYPDYGGG